MANLKWNQVAAIVVVTAALVGTPGASVADGLSNDEAGKLRAAIAGDHRTKRYSARDGFRHPFEVLSFFGVKPNMTVVELFPGGGWWTEILGPYLRQSGKFYAANHEPGAGTERRQRSVKRFAAKLEARPDLYGSTAATVLAPPKADIAPPGSADVVLTFRNIHNWMKAGTAAAVYKSMYVALKPGGILGVVEHRGNSNVPQDPKGTSGYVNESFAIKLATNAGFKLVAKSEINANPRDTKDHPAGVWTLPPGYRLKDRDRAKYQAIGESDRMTLKFVKPVR